jgi:hypothetical protein
MRTPALCSGLDRFLETPSVRGNPAEPTSQGKVSIRSWHWIVYKCRRPLDIHCGTAPQWPAAARSARQCVLTRSGPRLGLAIRGHPLGIPCGCAFLPIRAASAWSPEWHRLPSACHPVRLRPAASRAIPTRSGSQPSPRRAPSARGKTIQSPLLHCFCALVEPSSLLCARPDSRPCPASRPWPASHRWPHAHARS